MDDIDLAMESAIDSSKNMTRLVGVLVGEGVSHDIAVWTLKVAFDDGYLKGRLDALEARFKFEEGANDEA